MSEESLAEIRKQYEETRTETCWDGVYGPHFRRHIPFLLGEVGRLTAMLRGEEAGDE